MFSSLNASLQLLLVVLGVLDESPNLEVVLPPGDSNFAARAVMSVLVLLGLPNLDNEDADADADPESLLARLDLQLEVPIPDEEEPYLDPALEYPEFSLADAE